MKYSWVLFIEAGDDFMSVYTAFTCQTYHNKVVQKNRNENKIKAFPNYKNKTKQNTSGNLLVELAYKKI